MAPALLALLGAAACGSGSDVEIARRILQTHRSRARVKPLPAAQIIRLALSSSAGGHGAGSAQVEWDGARYRETFSSAGLTRVLGIQGGKAYLKDEDGVTRVASEPILAQLVTRSYFWRRAYLFADRERARTSLGPADADTVSVRLTPRYGDPLLLTFSRGGDRLLAARAPGFDLEFATRSRFRDSSRTEGPFDAEILSTTLPVGSIEDAAAGGWSAHWRARYAESALERDAGDVLFEGRVAGIPARIALDAAADGPVRARRGFSGRLSLPFQEDVMGRRVAPGATLEIGPLSYPSLAVESSEAGPNGRADAAVGAALFRETVIELDPAAGRIRFHDPARWVVPEGLYRGVLDDDGNRPVAIMKSGSETARLLAGASAAMPLLLTPQAARRLGIPESGSAVRGLRWGAAQLPPVPAGVEARPRDPEWEAGRIGFDLLLRMHVFFDMPHRWIYFKPLVSGSASRTLSDLVRRVP